MSDDCSSAMSCHFDLLWISNSVVDIAHALDAGIDWIFLDIELDGKRDRQPKNCFITDHSIEDLPIIRNMFPRSKILLRINSFSRGTPDELKRAIGEGVDAIMLPYFKTEHELEVVAKLIDNKCEFWPLVETIEACKLVIDNKLSSSEISRVHFGLNDLRLQLGYKFMFSPLLNSFVLDAINNLKEKGKIFGVGGLAPIDAGLLKGTQVLSMHRAMGSTGAILSREFRTKVSLDSLANEVRRIRVLWSHLTDSGAQINYTHKDFCESILQLENSIGKV